MTARGKAFEKGRSGNPAGRLRGSRNRSALPLEELLEGEPKAITRKAIEMAKAGDTVAMRLCLERLILDEAPAKTEREPGTGWGTTACSTTARPWCKAVGSLCV